MRVIRQSTAHRLRVEKYFVLDCTAEFASEQQQTTRECGDHRDAAAAAAATQLLEHHCRHQNITLITMIIIKIN